MSRSADRGSRSGLLGVPVGAIIAVAVVATVVTAGAGTVLVGAAVAAAGGAGSAGAATVATVGAVAVAGLAGAAGSAASTKAANYAYDRNDSVLKAAAVGFVAGVATGGVRALAGAAGRSASGAGRAAALARFVSSSRAATVGARAVTGAASGLVGGAAYETTRQAADGKGFSGSRIVHSALVGAATGAVAGQLEPLAARVAQPLYNAGLLLGTAVRASVQSARAAVTGKNYIIGEHGMVARSDTRENPH